MKQSIFVGMAAGLLIIAGIVVFQVSTRSHDSLAASPYVVPALRETYTNDAHAFSIRLPEGFTAREIDTDDDEMSVVVIADESGNGVQIVITQFGEDLKELTAAQIKNEVPDLEVSEPQVVEVGQNYRGVAFKSDNEAFEGASREVWFVFKGELYQISTYDRLDPLLKAIFSTWQFY